MMNIRYGLLLFLYIASINLQSFSANILRGNAETDTESFTFSVQQYIQNMAANNFYVGAQPGQEGTNTTQEFALARVNHFSNQFQGLTPKQVTLNGIPEQENPLFDQAITSLTLLESTNPDATGVNEFPVAVIPTQPATIYFFVDTVNPQKRISLDSVSNIPDATGATTSGVIDLAGAENREVTGLSNQIFAAVKPQEGNFGDDNSGIALIIRELTNLNPGEENKLNRVFMRKFIVIDAPTGKKIVKPRAARLDKTSSVVAIENNLSVMENIVSLYWDKSLQRLFIAVQVQAGDNIIDGARAIVVGQLSGDELILKPIVSSTAFDGVNNKIVGARGANVPVSIHKINTLFTSTALHYLIVLGGNGTPDQTQQTVFALPLVNNDNADEVGTIASKNAQPENKFSTGNVERLINRQLIQPALQPDQMPNSTDPATQVGGGPLEETIQDIFVRADTVFAMVSTPDEEKKAGIYYSQALFNADGTIKGWTNWERVAGTTNQVFGAILDPADANFTFMTGKNSNAVNTVKRTLWSDGDENGLQQLTQILSSEYPKNIGGIQNLLNFVPETPGLANIALLIATGLGKVSLIDTGQQIGKTIIPRTGNEFDATAQFGNGTITQDIMDTAIVTISGGVLDTIGAVTTAEIARNSENGDQGWLFVGGINGVAILSDDAGNGWNPNNMELGPGLTGLTAGMSFKIIGDYSFVRKIINDGNFLYVLTDTQLERIDLTQGNVGLGQIKPITVASRAELLSNKKSAFTDCIVSNSFALLGTSIGLFRVGNGKKITDSTNPLSADWTFVPLPEGVCTVTQLIPISKTGRAQDITNEQGGHIYILDAYQGKNKSRIHRFSIQNIINNNPVQVDTLTLFDDLYIKNVPSFLLNFGIFKQSFTTDGALYFATEDQNLTDPALALITLTPVTTPPRTGVLFVGVNSTTVPITLNNGSFISALLRNVASGSFLITGDFNVQVNE